MLKKIGHFIFFRCLLAYLIALYFKFVYATTRFLIEPKGYKTEIKRQLPLIATFWHGQHFMVHTIWPSSSKVAALVSRHRDGDVNARVLRRFGVIAIRGSGGGGAHVKRRGGVPALRAMLRALKMGVSIALTADSPKVSRKAGLGIIALAKKSGRPIYPVAVVFSRRIDLKTWDRASLPLPFGKGSIVLGDPIFVPPEMQAEEKEGYQQRVQKGLQDVYARAYAMIGSQDPGAARGTT